MKKISWLFAAALPLALLFGCQKSIQIEQEDGLRSNTRSLAAVSSGTYTSTLWQTTCIGDFYHSQNGVANGSIGANNKNISYRSYNTETEFFIYLKYSRASGSNSPTVAVTFNGGTPVSKVLTHSNSLGGTEIEYKFNLPANWVKGQTVTYSFVETTFDGQNPISGNNSYNLIGVCTSSSVAASEENPICVGSTVTISGEVTSAAAFWGGQIHVEQFDGTNWNIVASSPVGTKTVSYNFIPAAVGSTDFRTRFDGVSSNGFASTSGTITVEAIDCEDCVDELTTDYECGDNSVTFTFTATEAGPIVIQGGLSAGAVITSTSSTLTQITDHPSTGGPSSVTRWVGNVEACTPVTVTINYTGGNGIGAWSAKRGDLTLGSTTAVVCP